jgi:hypothetical protein
MAERINCAAIRFPMRGKMEAEQALSRSIDAKCAPRRQIGNAKSASVPVSHNSVGAGKSTLLTFQGSNPPKLAESEINSALSASPQRALWYIEFLQFRLHPVRGKGRSHLNQPASTDS